jgi:hypothetical protein
MPASGFAGGARCSDDGAAIVMIDVRADLDSTKIAFGRLEERRSAIADA